MNFMGRKFDLIEYLRRQAGTLAWRCVVIVLLGGLWIVGPATFNSAIAKSDFALKNAQAIEKAGAVADEASKSAATASTKADQLILSLGEIIKTQSKLFEELHAQASAQSSLAQSVAVIGEDVKAIQNNLLRDENQIDQRAAGSTPGNRN